MQIPQIGYVVIFILVLVFIYGFFAEPSEKFSDRFHETIIVEPSSFGPCSGLNAFKKASCLAKEKAKSKSEN
jgi:hypothetical protein